MGAILTTFPIADSLAANGYQATLVRFGLVFGAVGALAALGLRAPPAAVAMQTGLTSSVRDVDTATMLRSPIF